MVSGVIDTTSEDGSITTKDLNPSQSFGGSNKVAQNSNTRSSVGSSTNPRTTTQPKFRNAELEERKGALTRGMCRGGCLKCKSQQHDKDHYLSS